MEIRFQTGPAASLNCDALIVPVPVGAMSEGSGATPLPGLPPTLAEAIGALAADARFDGKIGGALVVPTLGQAAARRIVLVGVGAPERMGEDAVSRAFGAAAQACRSAGARRLGAVLPSSGDGISRADAVSAAVTGAMLGLYRYTDHHGAGRPGNGAAAVVEELLFADDRADGGAMTEAIANGRAVADAVALARDLVNAPAAELTPERFADRAVAVAEAAGLEVEVLGPAELEELGAGAILAVGKGSVHPPRLIRMRYRPADGNAAPGRVVGLVGKCITFDSGGYSIKTYEGMLEMKGDMAGGAAVLATMSVLSALRCPVAVDATICAAENMISGTAFRPGDILRALNGVAIEVLSTDAEGRLVLADGLVDAARRGATELIDLATLTGAIVVALGDGATGLFASDDRLANQLLAAAADTGERAWRMPLFDELEEKIEGDIGDVKNSGGRAGGAITAALFLRRFREGLPWAHLDIAGSSRFAKANPLGPKGGSGVGVRTLLSYLARTAESSAVE